MIEWESWKGGRRAKSQTAQNAGAAFPMALPLLLVSIWVNKPRVSMPELAFLLQHLLAVTLEKAS